MLFNSLVFLAFAAAFFALWPLARRRATLRWAYLVGASFLFYGWWDWRFLFLIAASGLLDYLAGLGMVRFPRHKRAFLVASITGNIGSLVAFKYSGFLAESIDRLLGLCGVQHGIQPHVPGFLLLLPIGISFYTFQSMSYTIDAYRGQLKPTRNLLHFFAYLSMFPQLVAGPIVRARDMLSQLTEERATTEEDRWDGLRLIAAGYFKKVVIADNLAPVVDQAFGASVPAASCLYWWLIVTMFAFQIYCDFSGYSDIARGLARWMGYRFRRNFDRPYTSASLREFWTRWHISLSTWFRDYVYIPLGGSRRGPCRTYVNLCTTMLLSGLWHGASWTFVAWGALHAAFLSLERWSRWSQRVRAWPGGRALATLVTLTQVWAAWVLFRAESLAQAGQILTRMFWPTGWSLGVARGHLLFLGIAVLWEAYAYLGLHERRVGAVALRRLAAPAAVALLIAASVYLRGPGDAFIYFQF